MPTTRLTIGTTALLIVPIDPEELEIAKIILQNTGTTNLYWGHDANVTITNGHYLPPNGDYTDDMELEPVWIVSDVAGGLLVLTVQKYLNRNVLRIVE